MRTLSAIPVTRKVRPRHAGATTIPHRISRGVRAAVRDGGHAGLERGAFTPLIDAKAASALLGVPYTWLLAQARERRVPHHRLGHYVRFNPDDLAGWLEETKAVPREGYFGGDLRRP